ncbi:acyl esterase [Nocardia sp. MDA0666]|nr:acyl esterase [Nocardia sp. MDA0666]
MVLENSSPRARRVLTRVLCGLVLLIAAAAPVTATAAPAPAYQWRQEFLTTPDGVRLHADILRPAGMADDVRTPVVMTVSPYRNHLAFLTEIYPEGGPSLRDLYPELFLDAGYTYVIVDLRGFGGSSGCPDFGGPGEQSDVRTAVEWAAAQPWSTGRVGLTGTSYEAWTGIMGLATNPKGLAAVAAFEPDVDPYSYLYMQGIAWKFSGKPVTEDGIRPGDMAGFEHLLISSTPAHPSDSPEYKANAARLPIECAQPYLAGITDHDGGTQFWRDRDLTDRVRGSRIPLFLGQGFLDYNTRAYRVFDVWNNHDLPEDKGWFGQWGHQNCHEGCGTPQFDSELLAFFDKYVARRDVTVPGPRVTVGSFDGRWRGEKAWPPADSARVAMPVRPGEYTDRGLLPGPDREYWSLSQPLPADQHLSGIPTATLALSGPPNATVAAELYDVAPDGFSTVITRGIAQVAETATIRLLAQDWTVPAGHRIGVRITDVVDSVWAHPPANARVSVRSGTVELPLLTGIRNFDLTGGSSEALGKWRARRVTTIAPEILRDSGVTVDFPQRRGDR